MKQAILFLALITIYSCTNSTTEKKEVPVIAQSVTNPAIDTLTHRLDSLADTHIFHGFSVAVVNEEEILYNRGFGYADIKTKKKYDENTIINIASISKTLIGVSLMKAQELGLLDLDDPINKYLLYKVSNPNHPNTAITIRHLATHTSSLADNDNYMKYSYINKEDIAIAPELKERYEWYYANSSDKWMDMPVFMRKLLEAGNEFYDTSVYSKNKPGELFDYSNIGATLCAVIIENATKTPFNEFTKKHIFDPLKMSATGWFFEEINMDNYSKLYFNDTELPYYRSMTYPDGGLITSSTDLSKFLQELIRGFSGKGQLLTPESYENLFASQLEEVQFGGKKNYNVGLFIEKELAYNVIGHSGGDPGTNTLMYFDSKTKTGRIMILNSDTQKENDMDVYWGIWNALKIL